MHRPSRSERIAARRIPPGPGQESVWDYPRPPSWERSGRHALVTFGGAVVADTRRAIRVLETSHPPNWYFPVADVRMSVLLESETKPTVCEWKGVASYFDVLDPDGRLAPAAAWTYEAPQDGLAEIAGWLSFMPGSLECELDGEPVLPQDGGFYGGWITDDVVGPFKGGPGTLGW